MRDLFDLTKLAAVLLAAGWTWGARAGPADTTARALVADWKDADRGMAAIAEVIASAFASGMSWAGASDGRPVYCPPTTVALTGKQLMGILESFVADNPDAADKPYGFALSATVRRAFPPAHPVGRGALRRAADDWRATPAPFLGAECATSTRLTKAKTRRASV